ncbi:cell division protein FtsI / penicillin-binding protein [Halarcobacter ebronensis]|uniref:Cell division protein FtsW n=1 Tax=Halarcobacter ebronensis TaxID=1462615 RepID=A0A4Q1AQG3_9BACT|nr:cell division protein FtsI / penicillin-binding protein [Halarcobacter ebronensis]RXK02793.1 cell division protein FtsW [Halarcobacter ebronensis]
MPSNLKEKDNKIKKIMFLFFFILFLLIVLIISIFDTMEEYRRLPSLETSKKELSVRGDIISSDNFKIATSKKIYKASIDTRFLDTDKKELFVRLFSIYSNIPYKKIVEKIDESLKEPGNLVLSYNIDSKTAKNLKELEFKLRRLDVFKAIKVPGGKILRGLTVSESGEKRVYSYEKTLTPVVGYITKFETQNDKTKVKGIKGLERNYDKLLNSSKDGILSGNRDVLSYISFNRNSTIKQRVDGANLVLNIPLKLQKNNEMILDIYKEKLQAQEIIISVMDSKTGKILSLASSNRFNPEKIYQNDIPSLNVNAIEYQFEPGSVIKPIAISLAIDKNRIKKNELFFAYNNKGNVNKDGEFPKGAYKLDRFTIKDDHQFKKNYLTLDDIFIFSSNIGTLQLAQRLTGPEFYEGMKRFGFTRKTGIDLPYEKIGMIPKVWQFSANDKEKEDNVFKATVSYGQGMTSTFMQILKAYSAFNNDGVTVTPKIVSYVEIDNNKYKEDKIENEKIISTKTANEIKRLLIKTVTQGTGREAQIDGLEIGGKTGTAQIARDGKYQKEYISSFFGFVNDEKSSYTIGVTVIDPISTGKNWYYHYAAWSAVPVFKEIVKNLVRLNYLSPKNDIISN